jgi:hypothetical protein
MYCPKCRAEYEAKYRTCSDCNIALVNDLPPEPQPKFIDYEEIIFTNNPGDSALLKSLLDAEDIQYYVQGEYYAPYLYHALPIRFFVRKDQAPEARQIIKDLDLRITSYGTDNLKDEEDEET